MTGIISCLKGAKESKDIPKTLVFCRTKEAAVNMYRLLLQSSSRRDYVSMFHASLTKATKQAIQHNFQSPTSALRCLVATVAFGMVSVLFTLKYLTA